MLHDAFTSGLPRSGMVGLVIHLTLHLGMTRRQNLFWTKVIFFISCPLPICTDRLAVNDRFWRSRTGNHMRDRIKQAVFSLTGVSLLVGVAGFLSAIVTMFINTSEQVSIKWVLFTLWLFLTFVIILLKLIFDLVGEKKVPPPYEIPIRYLPDDKILLIRRNEYFGNQIVVGCYSNVDDVERLLSLGAVHHVQDKFIQIKLLPATSPDETGVGSDTDLKTILVRPVVPLSALQAQLMRNS